VVSRPRLRNRLLQACALLLVIAAGVWGYRRVVRPDPLLLGRLAEEKLREIFGQGVEYDELTIDLVEGVEIRGLRVRTPRTPQPTLTARRVQVRHDLLALASGLYRPEAIVIEDARIVASETEKGLALDFPFHLGSDESTGAFPAIGVRRGELLLRAREGSKRLRPGTVVTLTSIELDARPAPNGRVELTGSLSPRGLGQDDVRIQIQGTAVPDRDELDVGVVWKPLILTRPLLDALAEAVAEPLRPQVGQEGELIVALLRRPDVAEGEVQVTVRWVGEVRLDLTRLPSGQFIDATSREQLDRLLQDAHLDVELSGGTLNLKGLINALGSGPGNVRGFIRDGGELIDLIVQIRRLRLESPDVRDMFEAGGRAIFEAFDPGGFVDADVVLRKRPGQDLEWSVDAILESAYFRYVGMPLEDGRREGFPYPVEHVTGEVHVAHGEVWFQGVVGYNGPDTVVRLRNLGQKAWTGGETGRIRITDDGPDIRITVDAENVHTDHDLRQAIEGSEFRDLFDFFWIEGLVDRVEVDIIQIPKRDDKAYAEVRLTLDDERFRYARFPMTMEGVRGHVTLRRPFLDETRRGQVFTFDVEGTAEGAPVTIDGIFRTHDETGHLHVEAKRIPLEGELARTVLAADLTQGGIADAWRWLDPHGRADVVLDVPLENEPGVVTLEARFDDATIQLGAQGTGGAVQVSGLEGTMRVVDDVVHLDGLHGFVLDSPVAVEGTIQGGPEGSWDVHVTSKSLRVTPELLAGLEHLAGESLLPEGLELGAGTRLALDVHLQREAGREGVVRVEVEASGLDGLIYLPDGSAVAVRADRIEVRDGQVALEGVRGEAPGVKIELDTAHAHEGGIEGRMTLHLEEVAAPGALLELLPEDARELLEGLVEDRRLTSEALQVDTAADGSLRLEGDLSLLVPPGSAPGDGARGRVDLAPLVLSATDAAGNRTLRGRVVFRGFTPGGDLPVEDVDGEADIEWLRLGDDPAGRGVLRLRGARILDLRVRDAVLPLVWEQGILSAQPLRGVLAEGRLEGRLVVHTLEPTAYEGEATIDGFRLEALREDLFPTGPPMSGLGQGRIEFQNRSGLSRDLVARGSVSIREGDLGDLPAVANIFALFDEVLGMDNPPRFERANALFTVQDEVVRFQRLDLSGPLFDMPGRGTLDFGGYADLVFTPDVIKSLLIPGVMQFPVVGGVLDALLREDWLYEIRLRGDLDSAEPEVIALPPLGLAEDRPFEGAGVPRLPPRRIPRWFR